MLNRRRLLMTAAAAGGAAFGMGGLLPAWARTSEHGNMGLAPKHGRVFDLNIGEFPVRINGKSGRAVGVNGTIPAPLIRFLEGEEITLNVTNHLKTDTSIHWHGLLVPFPMDGVPGVTFPGIKPGETFQYKYAVPQSGTYWYHSHSGLQEQQGHYGPIIIDPKHTDPIQYDREYVLVLSDWTFENPHRIFAKLKKMSDSFNFQKRTVADFMRDTKQKGFGPTWRDRARWGKMRMSPTDISDITGASYTYLVNGHGTKDNWNGVFTPGERIRLRIINASAMSIFNVRIPGLPMTIVAADGLNVKPHEIDEFQMGVAETYDVIIEPKDDTAYAFVAESIDRSGQVVATLGPRPGMRATIPKLRAKPLLTMKDMGMGDMDMSGSSMRGMDMGNKKMGNKDMDMKGMDHSNMTMSDMDHSNMDMNMGGSGATHIKRGPGVVNIAMAPVSRLDEPGIGLENVPHRTLKYADLRALEPNPDTRPPEREIELHLTSNMERYMWSFDGVKFSHVKESIKFYQGERVRVTLINDTMMPHPIHLHGMFFDLVNGGGHHKPRKHTVIVKPGEKLSFDVSAEHVGDWAFHCHLLYHMHAGMFQVVSLLPKGNGKMKMEHMPMSKTPMNQPKMDHSKMDHSQMDHSMMDMPEMGE
ncbi:MAG TPA: copper resistance system multicopper oxidase [Hellea balneolensis]|uniref:Copper resistance system multicopper oxidase n=1 Tax=Hellea balneolensis TaxID=287478 RepID=A0A7C5QW70_9PROT|nr:copper resistance system multicopper oxidase [Hellea balneolensis]